MDTIEMGAGVSDFVWSDGQGVITIGSTVEAGPPYITSCEGCTIDFGGDRDTGYAASMGVVVDGHAWRDALPSPDFSLGFASGIVIGASIAVITLWLSSLRD